MSVEKRNDLLAFTVAEQYFEIKELKNEVTRLAGIIEKLHTHQLGWIGDCGEWKIYRCECGYTESEEFLK